MLCELWLCHVSYGHVKCVMVMLCGLLIINLLYC